MQHFRLIRYLQPESLDGPAREWPQDHLRLVEDICGFRWLERYIEGDWVLIPLDAINAEDGFDGDPIQ